MPAGKFNPSIFFVEKSPNLEEERLNEFSTHTLGITFPLEVIS